MGSASSDGDRRTNRRYSRARLANAAKDATGREAVALLFTGLAVHSPIRDLVTPNLSGSSASDEQKFDTGVESTEPNTEIWVFEPVDAETPWADASLDDSFTDHLSWFESIDTIEDEPADPLDGGADLESFDPELSFDTDLDIS